MNEGFFEGEISAIINDLWSPLTDGSIPNVFMVLDCARDKRIEPLINNSNLEQSCLYTGTMSYTLKRVSPHIVKLTAESSLMRDILTIGWGLNWGIFFIAPANVTMSSIRHNCRKISKVQTPDKKILVFRYQDPRVLRKFLPICDNQQLRSIFGNAFVIAMESESAEQLIRYNVDISRQTLFTKVIDVCAQLK